MIAIEQELQATGLWGVYQRDVLDLEPILVHMSTMGMPIDLEVRYDRAKQLADRIAGVMGRLEAATPDEARAIGTVYKQIPKWALPRQGAIHAGGTPGQQGGVLLPSHEGLRSRPCQREVLQCGQCGLQSPKKSHFITYKRPTAKRPQNPCAGAGVVRVLRDSTEFYTLKPYTPSRHQLIRYHQVLKRVLPTRWDKKEGKRKVSFDEKALKTLMGKYPKDPLYGWVLEYRELDKLAGTYIGRPGGA